MIRRSWILGLLAPVMAACGVQRPPAVKPGRSVQRGLASFYGHEDGYDGRITASGRRFDKNAMVAAHYDLPFGTRVRVRHLRNGRRVDVTIIDRFPVETLRRGRIIDVSYAAARKLRMVAEGVARVELTVLS